MPTFLEKLQARFGTNRVKKLSNPDDDTDKDTLDSDQVETCRVTALEDIEREGGVAYDATLHENVLLERTYAYLCLYSREQESNVWWQISQNKIDRIRETEHANPPLPSIVQNNKNARGTREVDLFPNSYFQDNGFPSESEDRDGY